jgi:hypothetical protein
MTERARLFEGRKFLWDGVDYESEEEARSAAEAYVGEGFDVEVWLERGIAFVYTRRPVKEAAIEQS